MGLETPLPWGRGECEDVDAGTGGWLDAGSGPGAEPPAPMSSWQAHVHTRHLPETEMGFTAGAQQGHQHVQDTERKPPAVTCMDSQARDERRRLWGHCGRGSWGERWSPPQPFVHEPVAAVCACKRADGRWWWGSGKMLPLCSDGTVPPSPGMGPGPPSEVSLMCKPGLGQPTS